MNKIKIGLIGCGNVGSGVMAFLNKNKHLMMEKYQSEFTVKSVCDLKVKNLPLKELGRARVTKNYRDILQDPDINVVIELIGGLNPATEIIMGALQAGKNVVTANKWVISHHARELFQLAHTVDRNVYFESSVMAGVPAIKTITEGVSGNQFRGIYGIINGTCNYILSAMTKKKYTFSQALQEAQKCGYAEKNPTLDVNGSDSAHKLAILVFLAFGKFIEQKDIHIEGITHISHSDIEYAENLNLTIKLLAIAKKTGDSIEARVHPTLISKDHPLASINGIYNAISMDTAPLGDVLLSGEGAGQMTAASGIISDLINMASRQGAPATSYISNITRENAGLKIKKIDEISTRFYIRFMAIDRPGVLSRISGILGRHGISINSVTQKAHMARSTVPVVMLTDYAKEKMLRLALNKIRKLSIVKSNPVAIRMENLKFIFK